MRVVLLMLAFIPFLGSATKEMHLDDYLKFLKSHECLGEYGNYKEGKIEIVIEKKTIKKIEETQAKRYMRAGESQKDAREHAKVGIVAKDKYIWWIRDAVLFPSGATGTFDRIVRTGELEGKNNSVAILPVSEDNKIILNVMYRHALRSWAIEIPRGKMREGETPDSAAKRELKEETGLVAEKLTYLGEVIPYSGVSASKVPVYFAKTGKEGPRSQDYSEAIIGSVRLTKKEVIEGFAKGYLEVKVNGRKLKVALKDGYLSYAMLVAEENKLI